MKIIDLDKIQRQRKNKEARSTRPFTNFMDKIHRAEKLLAQIEKKIPNAACIKEAYFQYIISDITAFEVYFNDLFAVIFKLCDNKVIYPRCDGLIEKKFSIKEIIDIQQSGIKVEELILQELNFQNLFKIESVFSKLLAQNNFFAKLKNEVFQSSSKTKPFKLCQDCYQKLVEYINLRHELVHDFNPKRIIGKRKIEQYHANMLLFVVAVDIFIHKNLIEKNLLPVFVIKHIKN